VIQKLERLNIRKLVAFISIFVVCIITFLPAVRADTVIIQPSSQDAEISEYGADYNFGGEDKLGVQSFLTNMRVLVRFDLSIPPGSTVSSATLKLYFLDSGSTSPGIYAIGRTYMAYRVTHSWTEGTGGFSSDGVTWNTYDGTNAWTTAGGDYTTTGGASATVPSSFGVWMNWTVTDVVKAWVEDGEPNYGLLIKDQTEYETPALWSRYYSKEFSDDQLHPILEVTYTPPSGIPELSLPLVMVVSTAVIVLFLYRRKIK